jgi:hypothetical protein
MDSEPQQYNNSSQPEDTRAVAIASEDIKGLIFDNTYRSTADSGGNALPSQCKYD